MSDVDPETGDVIHEVSNLQSTLEKVLLNQLDKFQILSLIARYCIDLNGERDFTRQRHFLLKFLLENLLKDQDNEYYKQLLDESNRVCNVKRSSGYNCCISGCLYRTNRHKHYIEHLKKVHSRLKKMICNFRNDCTMQFSSWSLLVDHVKTVHTRNKNNSVFARDFEHAYGEQVRNIIDSVNVSCKCSIVSCGGRQFSNIRQLLTHLNTDHFDESRTCIFEDCSHKFSAKSESRKHFRTKHLLMKKIKLKTNHIVVNKEAPAISESDIDSICLDTDSNEALECSSIDDSNLFDKNETVTEDSEYDSLMAYSDFLNRMYCDKFVPSSTIHNIAEEFCAQSVRSKEMCSKKLRSELQNIPDLGTDQIEKIIDNTMMEDNFLKAQRELDSEFKLHRFIKENFKYCSPKEVVLNKEEIEVGCPKECFHYVPIDEALKLLLEDKGLHELVEKERCILGEKATHVVSDVKDGEVYKNVPFFKENPEAYCALFYSDALEVVNPLASARGKHKVVQIFWTLGDIPKHQRSQIDR